MFYSFWYVSWKGSPSLSYINVLCFNEKMRTLLVAGRWTEPIIIHIVHIYTECINITIHNM